MRIKWNYIKNHLVTVNSKIEVIDDGEVAGKLLITGIFDKKLYYQEKTLKFGIGSELPGKIWREIEKALIVMEKKHKSNL